VLSGGAALGLRGSTRALLGPVACVAVPLITAVAFAPFGCIGTLVDFLMAFCVPLVLADRLQRAACCWSRRYIASPTVALCWMVPRWSSMRLVDCCRGLVAAVAFVQLCCAGWCVAWARRDWCCRLPRVDLHPRDVHGLRTCLSHGLVALIPVFSLWVLSIDRRSLP